MPLKPNTAEQMTQLRLARDAKRIQELAWQMDQTIHQDGYQIRPAIGRTGGADNVGWELNPITAKGDSWYFATKELCLEAIPRHQKRFM